MNKVALFIPTFNAGEDFNEVLKRINLQSDFIHYKFIIDSSSSDDTREIAADHQFDVKKIKSENFGHGKTRTMAAKMMREKEYKYAIFMTQDVFLQKDALEELYEFIKRDPDIALVYGKQEVDLSKGNIFEYRSRNFNYPNENKIKDKKDIPSLGIKTVFTSDAFCIYDLDKLNEIGYFPDDITYAEDMFVAAKFINKGYKIGYCADSKVFHTHNYSVKEEFERYQYTGNFHKKYPEIQNQFGSNSSEGLKLVFDEIKYLLTKGYFQKIPESVIRNIAKYLGYRKPK